METEGQTEEKKIPKSSESEAVYLECLFKTEHNGVCSHNWASSMLL